MADNPRIVLTGGPCDGKTMLLRELRAADPSVILRKTCTRYSIENPVNLACARLR